MTYFVIERIVNFIALLLWSYQYIVLGAVILSWLLAFGVVNRHNDVVRMVGNFLFGLTEPLMKRIRRYIPSLGGLDLSPVVLLAGVWFMLGVVLPSLLEFARRTLA